MSNPMLPNVGKGAELRLLMERELSVPKGARWFTVRFAVGEAITVEVGYVPQGDRVLPDVAPSGCETSASSSQ